MHSVGPDEMVDQQVDPTIDLGEGDEETEERVAELDGLKESPKLR